MIHKFRWVQLVYSESKSPITAPILVDTFGTQEASVHAVIVSEDAVVECGWRLTQLSLTPAPSLLSTSASEPFSDASCSCSEEGAESTISFTTAATASGGMGTGTVSDAAGGSSGAVVGEACEGADADADARFRVRVL